MPSTTEARGVGLSLSGGGHRAALFGLGSLLYLIDADKGSELAFVSSVSGGSITNGYAALNSDLHTVTAENFRANVRPLAKACSTGGTVFAAPLTYVYLGTAALIVVGASALCFPLEGFWPLAVWVLAVLLLGFMAQKRGWVAERAFNSTLFHGARLGAIGTSVDHVICSADLQTARTVFFSGRFLYSYELGWGVPGRLRLSRAVQSSSALPGAFHPRRLRTAPLRFERPGAVRRLLLSDGGVYDNMATEWPLRLGERTATWKSDAPPPLGCDRLIVVNSSAGQRHVKNRRTVDVPLLGELTALLAVKDVLYNQTTAVRRRLINLRFRVRNDRDSFDGTLVQIDRSPVELAAKFRGFDDERGRRAEDVLELLGNDVEQDWTTEPDRSKSVKTSLSKIPAGQAARLMRHAYALTMANAHVLLGFDLVPLPSLAAFEELTR